jgi:hypothetical protein
LACANDNTAISHIGVRITELGNFNITLDEKDKEEIMAVWKDIRTGLKQAEAAAKKKQFELDQKFSQDVRYSNLAGQHPGYMQYAQAHAIMGAGDGMAQGGGNTNIAGLARRWRWASVWQHDGLARRLRRGRCRSSRSRPRRRAAAAAPQASVEDRLPSSRA